MWDYEALKLLEASAYALVLSRRLLRDFSNGPAKGIYKSRLDIRHAQEEVAPRSVRALTVEINKQRLIVPHVP